MRKGEMWVGDIDSVCLVLAYLKNIVGTKANKHCGESRKRQTAKCKQTCTEK